MTNRLSIRTEQLGSHKGIFMKFDIWTFFKNLLREQVLRQQQLHERVSILRNAQVRLLLQNGRRNQGKSLNIYSDVW
jgi:hypothetical protein